MVYGWTGVCRVKEVAPRQEAGGKRDRLYYTLESQQNGCMIYTPVDSDKVFMRPVISRQEALDLIDQIPHIQAEAYRTPVTRELVEHYEEALRSRDCGDLIRLTMSIHAKKEGAAAQKRRFGAVDERFLRRGEDLLFGELAAALGIEPEQVPDFIASRVETLVGDAKPAVQSVDA